LGGPGDPLEADLDAAVAGPRLLGGSPHGRLALAPALGREGEVAAGQQPTQGRLDGRGPAARQAQVVGVGADVVGVADDPDRPARLGADLVGDPTAIRVTWAGTQ
jgi:hypothetical protein